MGQRDFSDEAHDPGADPARILPEDARPVRAQPGSYRPYEGYEAEVGHGPPAPADPDDSMPQQARKGPSAGLVMVVTFGLVALACALLAVATVREGMNGLGRLTGLIPSMPSLGLVTTPTVTIDTSRPAVIDRVRALGRLETVEYHLEKVVSGKSSGPLPDFLTGDRILLVAYGEVTAGVDLSALTPEDITVVSDTVTIRLPAPQVLHHSLDNSRTYVYDRQTGLFSKPDPDLETQVRQAAEQQIMQAALEDGILDKARANAGEVLRTLITGLGYREVRFENRP